MVPGYGDYYLAVATSHTLKPYQGSADIFFCDAGNSKWFWYWKHMVRGGATFHRITGSHFEIITSPEHIAGLAKALAETINKARYRFPNPGQHEAIKLQP